MFIPNTISYKGLYGNLWMCLGVKNKEHEFNKNSFDFDKTFFFNSYTPYFRLLNTSVNSHTNPYNLWHCVTLIVTLTVTKVKKKGLINAHTAWATCAASSWVFAGLSLICKEVPLKRAKGENVEMNSPPVKI